MEKNKKKAIVLSSGGLDSTTAMAIAIDDGFDIYSLSFNYGQRHLFELEAAKKIAGEMNVIDHLTTNIDLRQIGGSALTADIDVPKHRDFDTMATQIPITYVPARNIIFLSFALAWAEVLGVYDIYIGVNAVDYSGYPDCRPDFIKAFEKMANLGTKVSDDPQHAYRIHTPLIQWSKARIIQKGIALGVDYGLTHSCYDPDDQGLACGKCDSCLIRKSGFEQANVKDPTRYQGK